MRLFILQSPPLHTSHPVRARVCPPPAEHAAKRVLLSAAARTQMPKAAGDNAELAAFPTRSRAPRKDSAARTPSEEGSTSPRGLPGIAAQSLQLEGVEDANIELCTDPNAGMTRIMEDTKQLATAFEGAIKGHGSMLARAIALTEERCAAEKRAAVEAATLAAIQTTEARCAKERRAAVEDAVREFAAAAKVAQEEAVAEAVRLTEERFDKAFTKTSVPATSNDKSRSFEEAAASAGAALAAVSSLLENRDAPTTTLPTLGAVSSSVEADKDGSATTASGGGAVASPAGGQAGGGLEATTTSGDGV